MQGDTQDAGFKPEKSKKWKRIEKCVRVYLTQLCSLLTRVSEPSVAAVILKHVHQMIPFFQVKGEETRVTIVGIRLREIGVRRDDV